ncbi:hypothetical protein ACIHCX_03355 [Streptomyces sp. NPDC052043]|uniref:hypothetical protein n=1 Tax=Streptomyces sp. NPDC052043 TaxID=3365684 RepID=UPI0037D875B5
MSNPTTSYGSELEIGDDAGHDDTPVCCDADMTPKPCGDGSVEHTCGDCGTVLEIAPSGVVRDIREQQTA